MFPVVALGLLVAVLLMWTVVRVGAAFHERTRLQTAVDATALSAATAYARSLNIVAVSNQVLFGAAVADLAVKLFGGGALAAGMSAGGSLTDLVMLFQDIWAGTGGMEPGVAPVAMAAVGATVGARNGLEAMFLWNGLTGPDAAFPTLNVRRATLADLLAWLAGDKPYDFPEGSRTSLRVVTEKDVFSYQPSSGGPRIEVPTDQVEKIEFERRGKRVTAYRMKKGEGGKAGRFVKAGKVSQVSGALDIPLPLIETSPVHEVFVIGGFAGGNPAAAVAETAGGEVFNEFYGDPNYGVRLLKIAPDVAGPGALAAMTAPGPDVARPAPSRPLGL